MKFDGYELKDYIVRALKDLKFKEFTPVQKEVFNEIKSGKNILAKSKTGSGKTHAFLIPIFNDLDPNSNDIFATIIAPTRELATQIYKMAQHIASFSDKTINIKLFVSGSDREREIEKLNKSQPHIVIGTPGKIKDLSITTNALKVYTSKYVVVDEVDMTFEEGFLDDVDNVLSVSNEAKLMFFSATIAISIEPFLKKYMTNVSKIDINNTNDTKIDHIWLPLKHKDRLDVLVGLLETINPYLCIIFVNKKETVNVVSSKLTSLGYFVGTMHGDLSPRERKRVLNDAKALKYQFIVATDLAARGIDIEGVSHIINYELPTDYEFYLHRSGRTGRMHLDGIVYSLYDELDDEYLDNLNAKGIKPKYYELKNGEVIEYKGRNTRAQRIKPKTDYQKVAAKYIPKTEKKPGYKKKRQAQIEELAQRLKRNDMKNKKKRHAKPKVDKRTSL